MHVSDTGSEAVSAGSVSSWNFFHVKYEWQLYAAVTAAAFHDEISYE